MPSELKEVKTQIFKAARENKSYKMVKPALKLLEN